MADEKTRTAARGSAQEGASPLAALVTEARREVEVLDHELAEIEMLVTQARTESGRHEAKRAQVAEKVARVGSSAGIDPKEIVELTGQLVTLTKRAGIMDAQVEVLTGKQKTLVRFRDALAGLADRIETATAAGAPVDGGPEGAPAGAGAGRAGPGGRGSGGKRATRGTPAVPEPPPGEPDAAAAGEPPAMSRVVLGAQEDLRREIARALHDGPAQSLTNIVLQSQIVERLMGRDVEMARAEVHQLVSMVQATLEATKGFIFEVRPMVLDDLGLVPTLRRAARERGRRGQVPVEFDSVGADRRLPMDLESGLFRMLDEALAAFLAGHPDRVTIRLDWSDRLEARIAAIREAAADGDEAADREAEAAAGRDLPPALAAMIEDRRAARAAARAIGPVMLPPATWREIQQRAASLGVAAELLGEGTEVRLVAEVPALEA